MKFVILSDLHVGPEAYYHGVLRKINKNVNEMLSNFVNVVNNEIKPDFVIVMGDIIEDDNYENDMKNMKSVKNILSELNCDVHYVIGNHDLRNMPEDDVLNILKLKSPYYSFDSKDIHFIVLYSKRSGEKGALIPHDQLKWLEKDLSKMDKKCIIFVHYGLADQDLKGNPWFDGRPEACLIKNRIDVRNVIKQSDKVIAVFNGHLHWDKKHVHDSIPYFTIQSIIENEDDKNLPSGAYAIVNIGSKKILVDVRGNYPKKFEHVI